MGIKQFTYEPKGVCSQKMHFECDGEIITKAEIERGCDGNLQGICKLLVGKNYKEVIAQFEGIQCGNKPTSCPDQIAKALKSQMDQ